MPIRQLVPKVTGTDSGLYQVLGGANTVVIVPVPGTAKTRSETTAKPRALEIYFVDAAGDPCEGRIAFAADDAVFTITATDTKLGHHKRDRQDAYHIPSWAKFVYLASPQATAVAKGSWLYE